MREGSAEAMACLTLRDQGLFDNELVLKLFTGATIALATDGIMRQQGGDLFDAWRIIIENSEAKNGACRSTDYCTLTATFSPVFVDELFAFTKVRSGGLWPLPIYYGISRPS